MGQVFYSRQADNDLLEIWVYIAQENPAAADRTLDGIEEACKVLADHPGLSRARPEIRQGMRPWPVGSHLVLLRERSDGIDVVRVIHGARDMQKLDEE